MNQAWFSGTVKKLEALKYLGCDSPTRPHTPALNMEIVEPDFDVMMACTAYGKLAEATAERLRPGQQVCVSGFLKRKKPETFLIISRISVEGDRPMDEVIVDA